jgi:hypothetical protein
VTQTSLDATHNFRSGALFIYQHRACYGDFIVNAALGLERFNLVMQERIFFAIFPSGRAAHNHNGDFSAYAPAIAFRTLSPPTQ